ncbi:glycerophosphodiester phosphodiesterase family protein [Brevibacterium sp. S111]|uniref:glycerophosphodiester phosphodiesterase family protein n=1 Tax=Brevibacterium sp. S111 TaxID=2483795 RepID=UPI0010809CC7|nr:glycerophosphodiester phosphodiesterase family protein [Brevibacterium sp. S111]TGD11598.1 hypothetical protein EB836_06940 [Brevibacterium sp. S111]
MDTEKNENLLTGPTKLIGPDGSTVPMPNCGHIVYVGNGATSQHYKEEFQKLGIRGMQTSRGSGALRHLAAQPATDNDPSSWKVVDGFGHTEAVFRGFHARRRIADKWQWYSEKRVWEAASAEMSPKQLILPGDDVAELCHLDHHNLVLDAQWVDQSGKTANCGSRMFSNELMAHALGGYGGTSNHNTKAAFEHAVENGYTYFEVDLSYTTDRRLVAGRWTKSVCDRSGIEYSDDFVEMTYERAMRLKPYGESMMDARELYEIVRKHPECTFEIDFHKVEGNDVKNRVRSLLEDFQYDESALDRLLIQAYSEQMHRDIDSVHHFSHYQFLVGMSMGRLDEITTYCVDTGICAVALRWGLATADVVSKIRNAGLRVLAYTISNDSVLADGVLNAGVDTVCTDHVTPEKLEKSRGRFGQKPFLVYYHSGSPDASETYSKAVRNAAIQGDVVKVPSGATEFRDSKRWANNGSETLAIQRFALPDKRFAGWHLRVNLDGEHQWFCTDGTFRTKKVMRTRPPVTRYLFTDEEALPVINTKEGAKFVMVAVWDDVESSKGFRPKWFGRRRP